MEEVIGSNPIWSIDLNINKYQISNNNTNFRRREPSFFEERKLWLKGYKHIAGVDEVGCGCWAGPLVSAAVILPSNFKDPGILDSKMLTETKRAIYSDIIKKEALSIGIGEVSAEDVDRMGLSKAKLLSVNKALKNLDINPDFVLIDGYCIDIKDYLCKAIIKGDQKVKSIAGASIIAKVYRDRIITDLATKYPHYKFENNKGYGTKDHIKALERYGICNIHRKSYRPIKKILNKK